MKCPSFLKFSRCKVVMNSKCGKKTPKKVTLLQYSFVFKAKQNRNGERNIQTNVSVKYLLNSFTMSVRTIVITTCQFHRGIMTISRLRSVSPSLLSCSSHFFRALKQNKAQSGLLYLLSDKSKYVERGTIAWNRCQFFSI